MKKDSQTNSNSFFESTYNAITNAVSNFIEKQKPSVVSCPDWDPYGSTRPKMPMQPKLTQQTNNFTFFSTYSGQSQTAKMSEEIRMQRIFGDSYRP